MKNQTRLLHASVLALALLATGTSAFAHGDAHPPKGTAVVKEQMAWGIAGDAKATRRTVNVKMLDSMRFSPERIEVKQGETVRFIVHNTGQVMHEFVIGTKAENDKHAALMMKFPDMAHEAPYMAHVPPGERGQIVWKFNRPGEFDFACLIAGHYQAGMVGKIVVRAR